MIPPIARRFVAGEHRADAITRASTLNEQGMGAIINLLGEHYDDPETAAADADTYCRLLAEIDAAELNAAISVKPTQLGLDIGQDVFRDHLLEIVGTARERDGFVWIDMEASDTTDATLRGFREAASAYPDGVGVCLQANLRRTPSDIADLTPVAGWIRLVKGAYDEPPRLAHQSKRRVNEAYRSCLETLCRTRDHGVAVASHDPEMIASAKQLHIVHGTDLEFQMLMGVAEDRQADLATDHRVVQYVPYGPRWFSYFTRRMLERTENLTFALRAVLGG